MNPNDWRRITRKLSEADAGGSPIAECRERLEAEHGQVWCSFTLSRDFEVEAFHAESVVVIRRSDGARGTVRFQQEPRFYWGFVPA